MLRIGACGSMRKFVSEDYSHERLIARPVKVEGSHWLCLCSDQCASQLAPVCFAQYSLGVRLVHIFDPAHRAQNDIYAAIKGAGLWHILKLKT
eukprot:6489529-Amphidinium_carterae.1